MDAIRVSAEFRFVVLRVTLVVVLLAAVHVPLGLEYVYVPPPDLTVTLLALLVFEE